MNDNLTYATTGDHLLATTRLHGGITLDSATGESPTAGYVVGGARPGLNGTTLTGEEVESWLQDNCRPGDYVGGWLDERTGELWFDFVNLTHSRGEAEKLCRSRGELAYFDLTGSETIYI